MFYLFHGENGHAIKKEVDKLKSRAGDPAMINLNTTRFTGLMSFADLRQAAGVVPFLAKVRLVLVENLFAAKPDKAFMNELLAFLPELPDTTRLIFMESKPLSDKHALVKLIGKSDNGYVKQFDLPQGNQLDRWIMKRVEKENGRITPRATHLLASNIGNNLQMLSNEIDKLLLYKAGEQIGVEDVNLLCPYVAEANIFDLVDAIGLRNGQKAAVLLQQKINEGADPFYLFAMFLRQFRLMILVKECAEAGMRPPAIAKAIRQHSYVVGKIYQQARGFSLEQLEQIYRHLLTIDVGVKTGKAEMATSLEMLVASLTMPV